MNLVIFGGPGSGKGTQSDKIVDKYGLYHISTGEVLRQHIADNTEIGQIANRYISQGQLIPDSLMIRILEDLLDNKKEETAHGVIFDGFPRTMAQAEELDGVLEKRGLKIDHVIGLEVPDHVLTQRVLERGARTGRADDNEETIGKRINVYHEQTLPLKRHYINSGKYRAVDGEQSIENIFNQITDILDNK